MAAERSLLRNLERKEEGSNNSHRCGHQGSTGWELQKPRHVKET